MSKDGNLEELLWHLKTISMTMHFIYLQRDIT